MSYAVFCASHVLADAAQISEVEAAWKEPGRDAIAVRKTVKDATKATRGSVFMRGRSATEIFREQCWREIRTKTAVWWQDIPHESKAARMTRFHDTVKQRLAGADLDVQNHCQKMAIASCIKAEAERNLVRDGKLAAIRKTVLSSLHVLQCQSHIVFAPCTRSSPRGLHH